MKKITAKVITISSQILVVCLFLLILFSSEGNNGKVTVVYNDNFNKMAERTVTLFEKEELMNSNVDENVVVVLDDNTVNEEVTDVLLEEKKEETVFIIYPALIILM